MLKILTGEEVALKPLSDVDNRLQGDIALKNEFKDHYIVFKLKSTNNSFFEAEPSKGILRPTESSKIKVSTVGVVDGQLARELSQKNKFMIEYIALEKVSNSIDEAVQKLKGPAVQHIKIFINTTSVRSSRLGKNMQDPSMVNSGRYSFHSMGGNRLNQPRSNEHQDRPTPDLLEKLKTQTEYLQKQRAKLIKEVNSKNSKQGTSYLKYGIVFILGLVTGNLANKHLNLTDRVQEGVSSIGTLVTEPEPEPEEEEGFFSIFNFGGEDEEQPAPVVETPEEEKPWWNFW